MVLGFYGSRVLGFKGFRVSVSSYCNQDFLGCQSVWVLGLLGSRPTVLGFSGFRETGFLVACVTDGRGGLGWIRQSTIGTTVISMPSTNQIAPSPQEQSQRQR